jgi:hypothetical protein
MLIGYIVQSLSFLLMSFITTQRYAARQDIACIALPPAPTE